MAITPLNYSPKSEPTALEKLQDLLRTLFQFELSDLDFGIYRLFRLKQEELKSFIEKQLPQTVDKAFAEMTGSDSKQLSKEVEHLAGRIRNEVDPDAILDSGVVKDEVRNIKAKAIKELIAEYETKKSKMDTLHVTEEQKRDVFNHLYNFFSRYYDACDFIPRRFYGARSQYAVPYSGAETHFHWANKDQHYVKTAEAFRDYAFTVEALEGPFRVRFIITSANVPKDNTKGERRYFFPLSHEITYDKDCKTLRVPFHYRLPIATELKSGSTSGGEDEQAKNLTGDKLQDSLLRQLQESVLSKIKDAALANRLAQVVNEEEVERDGAEPLTLFLKRLRHFAKRNTTDYFIHKNLKRFFTEELEFFIKDQILHLGDIEGDLEAKFRMLRAFRHLANDLITFLSQIEDVQLRLFEKRKFVLRTDYLVTIANIPKELRKEILDPKRGSKQLAEWKSLYRFNECGEFLNWKGKLTEDFLDKHSTLVVNTANFDPMFKERLLRSFDDLDLATDGILINAENYQALRLLEPKLYECVAGIYIDPPYNTGSDEFIYKDSYQHSSWICMMLGRLEVAKRLLAPNGLVFVQIGDQENHRLRLLGEEVFPSRKNSVVVRRGVKNVQAQFKDIEQLALGHDTIHIFAKREGLRVPHLRQNLKEEQPGKWDTFWRGTDRRTMRYKLFGHKPKTGQWRWEEERALRAKDNYEQFLKHEEGKKSLDDWYVENLQAGIDLDFVRKNDEGVVQYYVPPQNAKLISDNWLDISTAGNYTDFPHEKSLELMSRVAGWVCGRNGIFMDFFGGSGSAAHAIISMNRADGGQRRFVLVEAANYFDSEILPRLTKAVFATEWSNNQPVRLPTKEERLRSPRLIKILRLESYEDALHNVSTVDTYKRSEPRAAAHTVTLGTEMYCLNYLARLPLEESASMLQLDKLEHPFAYTLEVLTDNGPQTQSVDLIETFNYLVGLDVQRLESWENAKDILHGEPRLYRIVKGSDHSGKRFLVLWRDMTNLDPKAERQFIEARLKIEKEPFDRMLINGDTAIPDFQSLDSLFKQLMTE